MLHFFWMITMVAAVLAGGVFIWGLMAAESAPQEAAIAGVALAIAIIPYCFTRAYSEFSLSEPPSENQE